MDKKTYTPDQKEAMRELVDILIMGAYTPAEVNRVRTAYKELTAPKHKTLSFAQRLTKAANSNA